MCGGCGAHQPPFGHGERRGEPPPILPPSGALQWDALLTRRPTKARDGGRQVPKMPTRAAAEAYEGHGRIAGRSAGPLHRERRVGRQPVHGHDVGWRAQLYV